MHSARVMICKGEGAGANGERKRKVDFFFPRGRSTDIGGEDILFCVKFLCMGIIVVVNICLK